MEREQAQGARHRAGTVPRPGPTVGAVTATQCGVGCLTQAHEGHSRGVAE